MVNVVVWSVFGVSAFGSKVVRVHGLVEVVLADGRSDVLEEEGPGRWAKDGTLEDGVVEGLWGGVFGVDNDGVLTGFEVGV